MERGVKAQMARLAILPSPLKAITLRDMEQTLTHSQLPQLHLPRNPGMPLDLDWIARVQANLTTLSGDDTTGRVRRLCAKARQPVRADIMDALEMDSITTGAICVYHDMIGTAVDALDGSGIPVAAVSTGFPAGLSPFHLRVAEIEESVKGLSMTRCAPSEPPVETRM